jgi:nucleoside-diphosphate-sugar epimerase
MWQKDLLFLVSRASVSNRSSVFTVELTCDTVDDLGAIPDAHDAFPNPFAAYSASKKIALAAISEYVQQTNPKFDIINILPSVILGRNELATSRSDYLSGTNRYIVNIILGNDSPTAMPGVVVFVDDCAEVHVMALREDVNGNQNFTTSSGSVMWSDVNAIVKKEFASEVETEGLVLGGKMDTISLTLDVEKTVETFGISWVPFAEQVKSVVKHYLSLE